MADLGLGFRVQGSELGVSGVRLGLREQGTRVPLQTRLSPCLLSVDYGPRFKV